MGKEAIDLAGLALATALLLVGCGEKTEVADVRREATTPTSPTSNAPPPSSADSPTTPPSTPPGCIDPLPATPPEVSTTGDAEPWATGPELVTGLIDIAVVADGTTRMDDQLPWEFLRDGQTVHAVETADLDDDGKPEVAVTAHDAHGSVTEGWIVAGDTPAGTHDPDVVGIRTSEALRRGGRVELMDDLDGDGTREVLVLPARPLVTGADGSGAPEIEVLYAGATLGYAGTDVMALEPPASLSDVQPVLEVPGQLNWTLDLGGGTPALLSGRVHGPDETATLYLRHKGFEILLSTAPIPFTLAYVNDFGMAQARRTDASVLLRLLQSSRGVSSAFQWEIPLGCLGL